ncbi:uncharacterized protein LOC105425833 [Pogonomyrmex barbatus]|uniref:Uncharacterized protein LOC105425833 n=1 Tax=Pogonomyrmex barbatus TaxID=144034 RepID=A0A6I9W0H0_9HYME|nr:uncharacterized protein LOC105425833 [Pogonomyrmex barbatus]
MSTVDVPGFARGGDRAAGCRLRRGELHASSPCASHLRRTRSLLRLAIHIYIHSGRLDLPLDANQKNRPDSARRNSSDFRRFEFGNPVLAAYTLDYITYRRAGKYWFTLGLGSLHKNSPMRTKTLLRIRFLIRARKNKVDHKN